MNADRLYIDNELVDTPASGLNINLNYNGNVLDGLKGISTNYTNTIRLPRTEHNLAIFDESQVVSNKTSYPYAFHTAQYESDGVALIRNGRAVLMSIGEDSIDITIIWGAGIAFGILGSEKKLSDLTASGSTSLVEHAAITRWGNTSATPLVFHDSNAADNPESIKIPVGTATPSPCFRSVKSSYILSLINSQMGGLFDFQDEPSAVDSFVLASGGVMTGNGGALFLGLPSTAQGGTNLLVTSGRNTTGYTTVYKAYEVFGTKIWGSQQEQFIKFFGNENVAGFTAMATFKASVFIGLVFTGISGQTSDITLQIVDDSDNVVGGYSAPLVHVSGGTMMSVDGNLQVQAGKKYYVRLVGALTFGIAQPTYIEIGMTNDAAPIVGAYYNVIRSLPAVKIIDYIATLAAISGTFPVAVSESVIRFYTYESLFSSAPIDWSYKVAGYSVAYKASGWAQANHLRWADGGNDGIMAVDDDTIEQDRDWFKSQFAVGQNAYYPYFERKNTTLVDDTGENFDGQVWEYKQPKPCIFYIKEAVDTFAGISLMAADFAAMDFSSVVDNRYKAFAAIMRNPRIVDVDVRMNAAEIIALDLSATYYFEQLGGKFAIVSLQYSKGIAKCKMLRIPVEY